MRKGRRYQNFRELPLTPSCGVPEVREERGYGRSKQDSDAAGPGVPYPWPNSLAWIPSSMVTCAQQQPRVHSV